MKRGAVWCAAMLSLQASAAFAHSFAPAVLDLRERQPGVFDVVWKLPGPDAGSLRPGDQDLRPEFPPHCRRFERSTSDNNGEAQPFYWRIDCGPPGLRGATLAVRGLDGSRVDVIVRIEWQDGDATSGVLRSGSESLIVPDRVVRGLGAGASAGVVVRNYGRLGVEHILLGFDHLLFVLGLMLLIDGWGTLVKTISAFTLAHTLTLALATLGVVRVPPAPVEALIAVSIVMVALELTRGGDAPPTVTRRYPWVVAFLFGLLHGLGFAGALTEIGLPPDQIPLALLSFNLGVEVGQLAFVTAMVVPVRLGRRISARWSPARLVPAYAIGALAVAWALQRIERFWTLPS